MRAGSPWNATRSLRELEPALRAARRPERASRSASSVPSMSSGSPDSAAHRNGPLPSQKSGRMYAGTKPGYVEGVRDAGRHGPPRAGCCRSRRRSRPRAASSSIARTCAAIDSRARREVLLRVARAQRGRLLERSPAGRSPLSGSCAAVWSVTRSKCSPRATSSGNNVGRVGEQADRERSPLRRCRSYARERIVERVGDLVEVARLETPLDPRSRRPRRRGSPRRPSSPRAAARRPCLRGPRSGSCARAGQPSRSAARPRPRTSGTCPAGCPACRCRSSSLRSSARTSSGPRASSRRNSSQVAQRGTRSEFAMRTRGAHSSVRKTRDGLAALDEQRLVVPQPQQRADDLPKRLVTPRGPARSPVDDELAPGAPRPRDRGC